MDKDNNSAFEPIDIPEGSVMAQQMNSRNNPYVENAACKVGNIFMLIEGIVGLLGALTFIILAITFSARTNSSEWETNDFEYSHITAVVYGITGAIVLCFALWFVIAAAKQLSPKKANRKTQITLLVLACLFGNIVSIILLAIGLATVKEEDYY